MKTTQKSGFKGSAGFLFILLVTFSTTTAGGINKTFTWKYPVNKETRIILDNYNCDISIHVWDKNDTEFHLTVDATGKETDDETRLLKYLGDYKFSASNSSVNFHNSFWENRKTIAGRTSLEIKGEKDIVLTGLEMKGELWIPATNPLELESKYSEIKMEDFKGKLTLNLYNTDLFAGNLAESSKVEAKYSSIEFKSMQAMDADLYNCDFTSGTLGDIKIISKYSKINAGNTGDLDADSYSDKFVFEKTGDIIFKAKYSDLRTTASGKADFDCYEGMLTLGQAKDIIINSRYADFEITKAGKCTVTSSYSTKCRFGEVNSLGIKDSKYSNYKAEKMSGELSEADGYNDKLAITSFENDFKGAMISGKYMDISLGLASSVEYRLSAEIQYPDLDIDFNQFKVKTKILESSTLQYEGTKGTDREGLPVVRVNGYNVSLKITDMK